MNLDLREIPVVYINLDKDVDKKNRIEGYLNDLGFKTIIRSPGYIHSTGNRAGCSKAQYDALSSNTELPVIIMEDDATPKNFEPIIEVPDNADAVYLGVSSWGRMNGHSGPYVQYDILDNNMLRVYNMLGTHAILYLNSEYKSVCTKIANHQFVTEGYIDVGFTDVMKYYHVYAFNDPMFYGASSYNGTYHKMTSYSSMECFTYNKNYFLPERVV
jgi:hypothetical protein